MNARAIKAITLPAHWTPRASYILTVKRGKTTPKIDRTTVLPANADAECKV